MYVYKITNTINNKVYIGITQSIEKRRIQHFNCKKKHPLYNAIKKYGKNNFTFEVIDTSNDRKSLCELEKYYIKLYNSNDRKYGYNITSGGEDNKGTSNPRATLTEDEVILIRKLRYENSLTCSEAHKLFSNKISFSAFEKIWEWKTWKSIGLEYKNKPDASILKVRNGETNGNAIYTDDEVLQFRMFYVTHTLQETYNTFGINRSKTKESFRSIIDGGSYKHIPVYSKVKKCWFLNKKVIDMTNYTKPVSTISEAGE